MVQISLCRTINSRRRIACVAALPTYLFVCFPRKIDPVFYKETSSGNNLACKQQQQSYYVLYKKYILKVVTKQEVRCKVASHVLM